MSSRVQIPVDEYLRTSYQPDCDYVEGGLLERNAGDFLHSITQGEVYARLRLGERQFRVADAAAFEEPIPAVKHPSSPPLVVVEIVSPDDRHGEIVRKLDECFRWGCPNVWLVDPNNRRLYVYSERGLAETPVLELPAHEIRWTIDDLTG